MPDPPAIGQTLNLAALVDGTSQALLVEEKRMDRRNLGNYQWDDNEGYTGGWDQDTVRYTSRPPLCDWNNGVDSGEERFGSSHPGGFQVVFADGSVRLLAFTIDPATFHRLGMRGDGAVMNGAW